jgi:hypothetical protein
VSEEEKIPEEKLTGKQLPDISNRQPEFPNYKLQTTNNDLD